MKVDLENFNALDSFQYLAGWQLKCRSCKSEYPPLCTRTCMLLCRSDLSNSGNVPEAFAQLADEHLVVDGCSFPAHSQFLSAHSHVMQQLLTETQHSIRAAAQLRLEAEMALYARSDVAAFLMHVYQQLPIKSEKEGWVLYQLADQFEAPDLMERGITVIEKGRRLHCRPVCCLKPP